MKPFELQVEVEKCIRERCVELGLDQGELRVEPILNWGGFVNRSFRISDANCSYHLKLAIEPECRVSIRRWRDLAEMLEPFHAPRIIEWIAIEGLEAEGPLTLWIDAQSPSKMTESLAASLIPVIAELHAERALSSRLGPATTYGDSYRESYAQRFASDLEFVRDHRPRFVSEARLEVMRSEATRLDDISLRNTAFQVTTSSAIHGDLWLNNILVTEAGEWSILDWDDLRIGDPLIDFAMLLGPSGTDLRPLKFMDVLEPWIGDRASRERLAFYGRASLLDWVIDSLADYLDAETLPEHAPLIRREKERIHQEAFDLYRRLYLA